MVASATSLRILLWVCLWVVCAVAVQVILWTYCLNLPWNLGSMVLQVLCKWFTWCNHSDSWGKYQMPQQVIQTSKPVRWCEVPSSLNPTMARPAPLVTIKARFRQSTWNKVSGLLFSPLFSIQCFWGQKMKNVCREVIWSTSLANHGSYQPLWPNAGHLGFLKSQIQIHDFGMLKLTTSLSKVVQSVQ